MTRFPKALTTLMLLLACAACDFLDSGSKDDGSPGPADVFVGAWQGSLDLETYSGSSGTTSSNFTGKVTISRLSSTVIVIDFGQMESGACKLRYDVSADGVGELQPVQECTSNGTKYVFNSGTAALQGDALTVDALGTRCCTLTEPVTAWQTSHLTRAR